MVNLTKLRNGTISILTANVSDKATVYITNVHKGSGPRSAYIYAEVRDLRTDELYMSATLDVIFDMVDRHYIVKRKA